MNMRRVVGFAKKAALSFEGFNDLTIKVLTEETQEFHLICYSQRVPSPPALGRAAKRSGRQRISGRLGLAASDYG